ncbi:MAG: glycosyltransferase family 2 protein [Solirubrobacteraceae bacterium]
MTTVVVAHDSLAELRRTLPALVAELGPDDELVVVDNASRDGLADELEGLAPAARLVSLSKNVGFAAGANAGARAARGKLLVLLNPDAKVQAGWGAAIRAPWGGDWAAWMGLVLLEGGAEINTSGGVLHFTGFGWAGQIGQPLAAGPPGQIEVGFLSGACLAIPRARWDELGGFPEHFFMYCEDVDLSLRLRLIGGKLAVVPDAIVEHSYEFAKGPSKWRMLERNRWATVIRTYPTPLLVLVLPALLLTELGVWAVALRGGWGAAKRRASIDVLRELPQLLRERQAIQAQARISTAAFASQMTSHLDSPYFGPLAHQPLVSFALRLYWRTLLTLIRLSGDVVSRPDPAQSGA